QAADVVRLVHAVEGMPLALDLAAQWVRLLPVAEIVAELLASPELLASTTSPLPARERSLGASFDRSWRLLSALERAGLCGLAWLPGSFDRQMAQQVAGAALPILAALMDKSLLRRDGPTRFSIHPLLRQCALRHADDFDELAARHARYVARWMQAIDPRSLSMDAVEAEWPHIRPAWDWALAHFDAGVIAAITPALVAYCENRGLWGEAVAMLEPAVPALGGAGDRGRAQMLLWRGLAILHYRAGRVTETETAARNALRLAQRLGDGKVMLSALNTLGLSRWYRGEFPEAESFFAHALRRAEHEGNAAARASMLANLALVQKAMGRYEQALQGFANVIANERGEGSMRNIVSDLNNIANVYRALLRPAEALAPLHEALALCDAQGLASSRPFVLVNIGLTHFDLGERDRAAHWVERALAMSVHAEPHIHASALVARARLRRLAGETAAARHDTEEALEIATHAGAPEVQMLCVAEFGEILVAEGQREQGAALLLWAAAQKLQNRADRDAAKRAVDALDLDPDAVARCAAAL
ncbi:MAG: tetratricopeptide repeat protein, partial [Rhizobiales bacterium]|nr:tetratricopeptide repeat protein [Rhizobacter sp.]